MKTGVRESYWYSEEVGTNNIPSVILLNANSQRS